MDAVTYHFMRCRGFGVNSGRSGSQQRGMDRARRGTLTQAMSLQRTLVDGGIVVLVLWTRARCRCRTDERWFRVGLKSA